MSGVTPHGSSRSASPLHIDPVVERLSRATNTVMWDCDLTTNTLRFSSNIASMLGYDETRLRPERDWWSERIHPEDRAQAVATLTEAVNSVKEQWTIEYRFLRGDGTYARIREQGFLITDDDDWPIRMVGVLDDLTHAERKERSHQHPPPQPAEDALRESEQRYRLLFESNPQPMLVFDRETLKFLAVNKAMTDKYGYSEDEFLSMTIKDIRPPEDVPQLLDFVEHEPEGVENAGVWRHRLKDGALIDVEIIAHAVKFLGRPAELVMANDVTERLRAERALRQSEERFATFMDRCPAAAWIKDEHGRYLYVNDTLCREYQVSQEQVIGRTDFDLLRPEVAEQLASNDRAVLDGDSPIETTETIENPDGTDHIWLVVKFPMRRPSSGRLVGGFAIDITEQKRAEKALREHAEALERSNQELEQFAYVASHDLQEPLRMVASYTQLLSERYGGKLDADADEFIGYAVDGARRMQRLIDDLLLYSRVGSQGKEPSEVAVDEALDEAIANLASSIRESGAEIERGTMPTIQADRGQIVQLFQNLLSNAIKFRGSQLPRISIRAERRENEWMFSVCDNGIGIDPKYHDRIFVIFQRLHRRGEYAGTGIGLALCKRIVERHGGRIWVESSADSGAAFRFALPVKRKKGNEGPGRNTSSR